MQARASRSEERRDRASEDDRESLTDRKGNVNVARLVLESVSKQRHKAAVIMGADRLTYDQLWNQSTRAAWAMTCAGVGFGDRVLLFADNTPQTFVAYLASLRIGAILAPVHLAFTADDLAYVLKNCDPSMILVDKVGKAAVATHGLEHALPSVVVDLSEWSTWIDGAGALGGLAFDSVLDVEPEAPALIAHTSVNASLTPNPVTRSHGAESWNAVTYRKVWDFDSADQVLIPLPLSWVYGLSTVGLTTLSAGGTIILQSIHETEPLLPAIQQHHISILAGTMAMYSRMLGEVHEGTYDFSSLSHLYIGGEQIVLPLLKLIEHYTGIRPLEAYASTEVAPVLAIEPTDNAAPEGTVGRLLPGSEIRLVDGVGQDVDDGEVGEAWLRGNGAMLGYWNEPDLTASRMTPDGWYKSGDYLRRDAAGYYFMFRRSEDVINRNGAMVSLADVEAALADVEGVDDVVVVAVPDDEFGEALIAFVVADEESMSIETIYGALDFRISRAEMPREIYILKDFPLDVAGKRDRQNLRALAQELDAQPDNVITLANWRAARSDKPGKL